MVVGVILLGMSRAGADTNRFNLLIDYPPTLQTHFTYTPETPVLGRFQPYVGLQTDYSYRPLRVTDVTTLARRPVMDYILAEYLYAAVGIAPRLQLGVVIPFLLQTSFINPGPVVQPAAVHKRGVGDIRFDAAATIMDRSQNPAGLSILGFVTVPTGPESEFLGSSGVTGGGQLVVDTARWRRFHLSGAIGAIFHKKVIFENLNIGQQLEFTTGAAWDFIPAVSATAEFRLRTPFNNFMKNSANTPMEARAGMDWRIGKSGVALKPGVGFGITYGSSQPLVRGLVAVTYTGNVRPPRPSRKPPSKAAPAKPVKRAVPLTSIIGDLPFHVPFEVGSARLRPDAMPFVGDLLGLLRSPTVALRIQGHVDLLQSPIETQQLAIRRAQMVMQDLVRRGANPAQLTAIGLNGWLPLDFPNTASSPQNCRVDFVAVPTPH